MIKKTLAVVGIISVLLLTFLIPASALEISYTAGSSPPRTIPVPVSMTTSIAIPGTTRFIENFITLPSTISGMKVSRVRSLGYVCDFSNWSDNTTTAITWQSEVTGTVTSRVSKITYTFPTFVYDVQEDNNFNDGYDGGFGNFPDISRDYNLTVSQELDWVYVFEDGTTSVPQFWYQTVYNNGPLIYLSPGNILPTPADFVREIVDLNYPTSEYADKPLDYIIFTRCSFEVKEATQNDPNTLPIDLCSLNFGAVYRTTYDSTQYHVDTTDYNPMGLVEVVFDGNVGVADLLIGPLDALINFEIFPNFSLGSVFAILAGISLFVIVLKVFAGG